MQNSVTKTTGQHELLISRLLNAPIALVWEVWTEPAHIKNWWGPTGFTNTIATMQVKEGGEWNFIMHGPDGRNYNNKIVYVEIIKHSLIRYKHVSFPHFDAIINFEAQGNKTLLTWRMIFATAEELHNTITTFKADEGLKENLVKLGTYLENILQ